jgi:hypothetical protein
LGRLTLIPPSFAFSEMYAVLVGGDLAVLLEGLGYLVFTGLDAFL